jgi:hypothetical protein
LITSELNLLERDVTEAGNLDIKELGSFSWKKSKVFLSWINWWCASPSRDISPVRM